MTFCQRQLHLSSRDALVPQDLALTANDVARLAGRNDDPEERNGMKEQGSCDG